VSKARENHLKKACVWCNKCVRVYPDGKADCKLEECNVEWWGEHPDSLGQFDVTFGVSE
jgi:hypothetical protein